MKKEILTEKSNPNTINIDLAATEKIIELINDEDNFTVIAVKREIKNITNAVDIISSKMLKGGNLLYFGAGTSGRLGVLDASECPPTFGVDENLVRGYIAGGDVALRTAVEGAEDDYEQGIKDLHNSGANEKDVVVGISASGNPRWLIGVLSEAKKLGITTVGLVSNPEAKIKEFSDVFICPIVDAEAIAGSSRMKSGTVQKMVLNMLSTASMIKIGKTYKNFMIDLKATNSKLRDRAARMVSEITNVPIDVAFKTLEKTDFNVKTSIVMLVLNCDKSFAEEKLKENNGILRKVISN